MGSNYPTTRRSEFLDLFHNAQHKLEDFWNVLEHPDFPFATLSSITNNARNFPPYNIIETKSGKVRLDLAVAGYTRDRLKVELKGDILTIAGLPAEAKDDEQFRHRGMTASSFMRVFDLKGNPTIEAVTLVDGILSVTFASKQPEPEPVKSFEIK